MTTTKDILEIFFYQEITEEPNALTINEFNKNFKGFFNKDSVFNIGNEVHISISEYHAEKYGEKVLLIAEQKQKLVSKIDSDNSLLLSIGLDEYC